MSDFPPPGDRRASSEGFEVAHPTEATEVDGIEDRRTDRVDRRRNSRTTGSPPCACTAGTKRRAGHDEETR
jgi:hypothetical protein